MIEHVIIAIAFLVAAGGFLEQFAWGIGLIAGLWWFVSGGGVPRL
jgi:hypothetical protein